MFWRFLKQKCVLYASFIFSTWKIQLTCRIPTILSKGRPSQSVNALKAPRWASEGVPHHPPQWTATSQKSSKFSSEKICPTLSSGCLRLVSILPNQSSAFLWQSWHEMDLDTIMASFPSDTEVLQQEHPPSSPSLRPVWWSLSPCLHGSQRLNWMAYLKKENQSIKRLLQGLPVIHHNSSLPTRAKYKVHQSTRIYVHLQVMRLIKWACFVPTPATKDIPYKLYM